MCTVQAKQFREQQRLGLLSQEEFALDTSALSKRKADMAGVAAWPEDNEGPSDDDFDVDAPSQVAFPLQAAACNEFVLVLIAAPAELATTLLV